MSHLRNGRKRLNYDQTPREDSVAILRAAFGKLFERAVGRIKLDFERRIRDLERWLVKEEEKARKVLEKSENAAAVMPEPKRPKISENHVKKVRFRSFQSPPPTVRKVHKYKEVKSSLKKRCLRRPESNASQRNVKLETKMKKKYNRSVNKKNSRKVIYGKSSAKSCSRARSRYKGSQTVITKQKSVIRKIKPNIREHKLALSGTTKKVYVKTIQSDIENQKIRGTMKKDKKSIEKASFPGRITDKLTFAANEKSFYKDTPLGHSNFGSIRSKRIGKQQSHPAVTALLPENSTSQELLTVTTHVATTVSPEICTKTAVIGQEKREFERPNIDKFTTVNNDEKCKVIKNTEDSDRRSTFDLLKPRTARARSTMKKSTTNKGSMRLTKQNQISELKNDPKTGRSLRLTRGSTAAACMTRNGNNTGDGLRAHSMDTSSSDDSRVTVIYVPKKNSMLKEDTNCRGDGLKTHSMDTSSSDDSKVTVIYVPKKDTALEGETNTTNDDLRKLSMDISTSDHTKTAALFESKKISSIKAKKVRKVTSTRYPGRLAVQDKEMQDNNAGELATVSQRGMNTNDFELSDDREATIIRSETASENKEEEKKEESLNDEIDELATDDLDSDKILQNIPKWAQEDELRKALQKQQNMSSAELEMIFGKIHPPTQQELFGGPAAQNRARRSSAMWESPIWNPRTGTGAYDVHLQRRKGGGEGDSNNEGGTRRSKRSKKLVHYSDFF